jgi:hypothetical protein
MGYEKDYDLRFGNFCICSRFGLGIIDHEFSSLVVERKE